jgi:uncharacterized protein with von Willebrand factor type A (vWA) domain
VEPAEPRGPRRHEHGHDDLSDEDDAAALRRRLTGVRGGLPEAIKKHLEALLALENRVVEGHEQTVAEVDAVGEHERMEPEESLRRLARSLHGGLTHKREVSARGRIGSGRTMPRNMRFDGIPFAPVTVRRAEDKTRLVILTDVSLSVRATARFTLHLVHGLQSLFGQVRTFAFVAELAEVTDLFADHPVEQALGLIFGGDVLDVDANSEYGAAFGRFHEDFGSAINRRSTVIVLGDGRGNGNDAGVEVFAEITRRARETIWLTPEPRYSWGLGAATCRCTRSTARACGWCATSPVWRARRRRWRRRWWAGDDVQRGEHPLAVVDARVQVGVVGRGREREQQVAHEVALGRRDRRGVLQQGGRQLVREQAPLARAEVGAQRVLVVGREPVAEAVEHRGGVSAESLDVHGLTSFPDCGRHRDRTTVPR